jgi:hypothetical protein
MFVVIAFLIHSAPVAHRTFALAYRAVVGCLIPFCVWTLSPFCQRDHAYDGNQSLLLHPKYPSAANFSYRPAFISGLRFFRMLAILVRSARASDPLGVWMFLGQMFLGHVTIDPVGSPDLWCSV